MGVSCGCSLIYPANAIDSCLRGDKVPLGTSLENPEDVSVRRPVIAFLSSSLVLFFFSISYCLLNKNAANFFKIGGRSHHSFSPIITVAVGLNCAKK